jgi:hypothetical protein
VSHADVVGEHGDKLSVQHMFDAVVQGGLP